MEFIAHDPPTIDSLPSPEEGPFVQLNLLLNDVEVRGARLLNLELPKFYIAYRETGSSDVVLLPPVVNGILEDGRTLTEVLEYLKINVIYCVVPLSEKTLFVRILEEYLQIDVCGEFCR